MIKRLGWFLIACAGVFEPEAVIAKTCTSEFSAAELGGTEIGERKCGPVAVKIPTLGADLVHHRYRGEISVRVAEGAGDAEAKVALAFFDGAGNLLGTANVFVRKIESRPKSIPFEIDGVYAPLSETRKIVCGVSVPDRLIQ